MTGLSNVTREGGRGREGEDEEYRQGGNGKRERNAAKERRGRNGVCAVKRLYVRGSEGKRG